MCYDDKRCGNLAPKNEVTCSYLNYYDHAVLKCSVDYRIARNFCGPKILRIAVKKPSADNINFCELNFQLLNW